MTTATQELTGTYAADPGHSTFQFAVKHMKVSTFRAGFSDVDARFELGDDGEAKLHGAARAESISITSPAEFREHVVNGEDFFNASVHPEITFRSDDIELAGDGTARVNGELEIKGISKPVVATGTYQQPVEDSYGRSISALELKATLDRREWDMSWQMPLPKGGDVLGYDVELTVHLELIREES